MADSIFSVRIGEELKVKFNEMAKDMGINNKEFMEQLISVFQLNKASDESSINVHSDINELQQIAKRTVDIYVNLIERININNIEKAARDKKEQEEKEKEIIQFNETIKKEKEIYIESLDKIKIVENKNLKLQEQLLELEEINNNFKSLRKMHEDKIEDQNKRLQKEEETKIELEKLKEIIKKKDEENKHLLNIMDTYSEDNSNLKNKLNTTEQESQILREKMKEEYNREVTFVKEKEALEKDKALLGLKETHYEKLSSLQNEFNTKIMNLLGENKEATSKIHELEEYIKGMQVQPSNILK